MNLLRLFFVSLLCCLSMTAGAQHRVAPTNVPSKAATEVTIYASIIYDDTWDATWSPSGDKAYGICAMTPSAPSFTNVSGVNANLNAIGGGFYKDGHYYCISYWTAMGYYYVTTLNEWNVSDWTLVRSTRTEIDEATSDMTYDPITDCVYGCFMKADNSGYEWGIFDIETAKHQYVADLPERLAAVAADGKGGIFAIGARGVLYSVEPATAKLTRIANTGHTAYHLGSGVIDERTGDLYWFCYPSDTKSHLFRVNTTTGECSLVYNLPKNEEFVGAFILPPSAEGTAPDEVEQLAAHFEGTALSGSITFNLPTTDYDGNPLATKLNYFVELEGQTIASGDGRPGESISINYTAPKGEREYVFTVYADNGQKGAPATLKVWVGGDAPKAVSDILTTHTAASASSITVSWTAPSGTQHGGNVLGYSYDVVRQPDGIIIASHTTATSITDNIPDTGHPVRYTYDITPYNGDYSGPTTSSAGIVAGSITLPYTENFDTEEDFNLFTVVDANKDGMTWTWHKLASGSKEATATCNTPERTPQDDWLITPALQLKKGQLYRLSFYPTCRYNYYPQKISASLGRGISPADMTQTIVPTTVVKADLYDSPEKQQIVETFTVSDDGVYYIGLHAESDPDSYYLHVDRLVVEVASSIGVPAAVSDLVVTPDANAELRATISLTAPAQTVVGNPLAAISRIEVRRGETLVKSFANPTPGSRLTFTDENAEEGYCTYSAIVFNGEGKSESSSMTKWIGFDTPEAPIAATVRRADGRALITWQAPQTGTHGGVVVPERLTYDVLWSKGLTPVQLDVAGLSATDQPTLEAQQELIQYYVCAKAPNGKKSAYAYTNKTIYGKPYELPLLESFAESATTVSPWFATALQGDGWYSTWNLTSRGLAPYVTSYDNDGGLATCALSEIGDRVRYSTPLITLRGSERPQLEFFYYYDLGSKDRLHIDIAADGGDYTTLSTIDYAAQKGETGWRKVSVNLNDYKNAEYVQIGFVGERRDETMHHIHIDHVAIGSLLDYDLSLAALNVPRAFLVGQENTISASVENVGTKTVPSATVALYLNGEKVDTEQLKDVAPGTTETVEFVIVPAVNLGETSTVSAEVVSNLDLNTDNNASDNVSVRNQQPLFPAVTDLRILAQEETSGEVNLIWSEPDLNGKNGTLILDDFENYNPFIIENIGQWTLYDGTLAYTYGVGGVTYPHAYEPAAWQVFNPSAIGITADYWTPYSGDQILVSFDAATYDPTDLNAYVPPTDHWLISPLLPGQAQTVTFMARSVTETYGAETFQLLYTTNDGVYADYFKVIPGSAFEVGASWTKVSINLPKGARRFAIRHTSLNNYALLIDDVNYRSAEAVPQDLTLTGYNIYRDGRLLNDAPSTATSFTDMPDDLDHNYNVTAVYTEGESAFSNTVNPAHPESISTVVAEPSNRVINFYDLHGRQVHRNAQGIIVSSERKAIRH